MKGNLKLAASTIQRLKLRGRLRSAATRSTAACLSFSSADMRFDFHGFYSFCFGEAQNEGEFKSLLRVQYNA